jgi:hypothetical protein
MGWTASCRGLVEAVGDSMHALMPVGLTIAEHHRPISAALLAVDGQDLFVNRELEDMLIHFSHARRITKSDKDAPPSHRAKHTAEYIALLDSMKIPGVTDLYSELCEFMHPAASSVSCMFVPSDDGLGGRIDLQHDARVIKDLLTRHRPAFRELLMPAFNPILLTFRVLDHFGQFPAAKALDGVDFSSIPAWRKTDAALMR